MNPDKSWVILGKSGAGKSTLARLFKDNGYPYLSCSDLLRNAMKENFSYSVLLRDSAPYAKIIPDEIIFSVIEKDLMSIIKGPFVLESFPVNLNQFYYLIRKAQGKPLNFIFLDIEEKILINRILSRRTCSHCFKTYNLQSSPPRQESICDDCGSTLFQREQDHLDRIRERFYQFDMYTVPMMNEIKKLGHPLSIIHSNDNISKLVS